LNQEFIDENFARWIEPGTTEQSLERLDVLKSASARAAQTLEGKALVAVSAAHDQPSEEVAGWVGAEIRAVDESFITEGKDDLLRRVAAVAVLQRLTSSNDQTAILCALAVASAEFAGFEALIPELQPLALTRVSEMGREIRERGVVEAPSFPMRMPSQRKATEEAQISVDDLAADVYAVGQSVKKFAAAVEVTLAPMVARQAALDEEVEMLWWVISDTDESGVAWIDREAVARAVAGALELNERTHVLPGPPAVTALLQKLLGDNGAENKSLAEVANEAARQEVSALVEIEQPLMPIASARTLIEKFATADDQETWQKAMENQLGLDPSRSHSLTESALQIYRELLMARLLSQ
jgi:hypothetical protein